MLAKLEGIPEGEEEPPHRWWLVLNVVTGYALKGMGIQPQMRDFLVAAPDENDLRGIFSQQYHTIDFEHMHLEIYSLGAKMPERAYYTESLKITNEEPENNSVAQPERPRDLLDHPCYKTGVMEIKQGRGLIDGDGATIYRD